MHRKFSDQTHHHRNTLQTSRGIPLASLQKTPVIIFQMLALLWNYGCLTLSLPAYHCRQWNSWRIYASPVAKGLISHAPINYSISQPRPNQLFNQPHPNQSFNQSATPQSIIQSASPQSIIQSVSHAPINYSISHAPINYSISPGAQPRLKKMVES